MARKDLLLEADVIVAGSGPGGSTVARGLAKAGKKVLLLERGLDHRGRAYYGSYVGALMYSERMSLLFTREGLNIIAPVMLGGATGMYCGCAAPPPAWLRRKYRIDIDADVEETIKELGVRPLPAELRGQASTRIADAAGELGYRWFPQPKFMDPKKSPGFNCSASCMLGCRCGAKWNAAEYADEAVRLGADLRTEARVDRVIVEGKSVAGVEGSIGFSRFRARAGTVVLSAGGLGTPRILRASGFEEAGRGMSMDVTTMVYGEVKGPGNGPEPPMTWSWENDAEGYMLSTLVDPWLLYPLAAVREGIKPALMWRRWGSLLGVMIKLKDDISGGLLKGGGISKPLSVDDARRLRSAREMCEQILRKAGASYSSIFMRPLIGTHPGGTVRLGAMLDKNLRTNIDGLYVCDASVFPESLDRPTVLTIIGLGKRLVRHLLMEGPLRARKK